MKKITEEENQTDQDEMNYIQWNIVEDRQLSDDKNEDDNDEDTYEV